MAEKSINARQQQKIDTSANWVINNPVLLNGEIGIESDKKLFKVGDGVTAWNDLGYVGGSKLYDVTGQNTDGSMTQKATTDELNKKVEYIETIDTTDAINPLDNYYTKEQSDTKFQDKLIAEHFKFGVTMTNQNDTVKEYFVSSDGTLWYAIWASGRKEFGQWIQSAGSQTRIRIPFKFSNVYYSLNVTQNGYGKGGNVPAIVVNKNEDWFDVQFTGLTQTSNISIYACGY